MQERPIIHPGDILHEEFMKPAGIDTVELARRLRMCSQTLDEIIQARGGITATLAIRLARFFGTSERFWLELQISHDLETALRQERACEGGAFPAAA